MINEMKSVILNAKLELQEMTLDSESKNSVYNQAYKQLASEKDSYNRLDFHDVTWSNWRVTTASVASKIFSHDGDDESCEIYFKVKSEDITLVATSAVLGHVSIDAYRAPLAIKEGMLVSEVITINGFQVHVEWVENDPIDSIIFDINGDVKSVLRKSRFEAINAKRDELIKQFLSQITVEDFSEIIFKDVTSKGNISLVFSGEKFAEIVSEWDKEPTA